MQQIVLNVSKKKFQPQLTVPSHKQTLFRNTYKEEKYLAFFSVQLP